MKNLEADSWKQGQRLRYYQWQWLQQVGWNMASVQRNLEHMVDSVYYLI